MTGEKFLLEELDDSTRDYLRTAQQTKGDGLAGIYVDGGSTGPWWIILVGLGVLVASAFILLEPLADPVNVTMLLTAGVLLGGWLVVAGIRIYIARSRGTNLGTFTYGDPWWLWTVQNSTVETLPMESVDSVLVVENHDGNGNYTSSTMTLAVRGVPKTLTLGQEVAARELEAYVQYWLGQRGPSGQAQAATPSWAVAHAGVAKAFAFDAQTPLQVETPREVPQPQKVRSASAGWLNLLIVALVGVGLYFALYPLVTARRDDVIFELFRTSGAPGLRSYLLDTRNTRHRDQVMKLLAARYNGPLDRLATRIREAGDPKNADGITEVVRTVSAATQPIITIRVREEPDGDLGRDRAFIVQKQIVDGLLEAVGQDLLAIAQPPEGTPAFIDLTYAVVRDEGQDTVHLESTLVLRKSPEAEPFETLKWRGESVAPARVDEQVRLLAVKLTGAAPVQGWELNGKGF